MSGIIDDPQIPEFGSAGSYQEFERRVRENRRFVWDKEIQAFLDTVLNTREGRDYGIPEGSIFWRAQLGIEYQPSLDASGTVDIEVPSGFPPARMKPRVHRVREGRVNPAGIAVLYLASTDKTAISEVRPWAGSGVSVAQVKILRNLKAIDLSQGHGKSSISLTLGPRLRNEPVDARTKGKAVWMDIDNAFSSPVTLSDDTADYVPTQILGELFRDAGYDAIIYQSQFGDNGYNIAVFEMNDAEIINCAPFEVKGISVDYEQMWNRYEVGKLVTHSPKYPVTPHRHQPPPGPDTTSRRSRP